MRNDRAVRGRGWLRRLAVLAVLGPIAVGAVTFTATLDRDTITLGESTTLSLAFGGVQTQNPPELPDIPNLQISYLGPSSQFSYINGQATSSVTFNFNVAPRQPGGYTIPALTVNIGGQQLTSQPLLLKVLKPNAPSAEAINSGNQLAFIKLQLPRSQVYVGESFPMEVQCYLNTRLQGASQLQPTGFPADGFSVSKMVETQHRQVQVGNSLYTVIPLSVALKVVKAGPLTIGPVTFNLIINQRDPSDPFAGFFGRVEQKQMPLASQVQNVQALPLPHENVPANFNGAVGNYTMNLTAGPTTVTAGDPITVKVQISGRGSLDALNLPDQPAWHEFKTYPPTTKVETTDQLGLQGTKTFEEIVTPENADIKALPALSFSFFDPDQKAYRTLTQPPVALVVRPGGSAPAPTILTGTRSAQDNQPPSQDIVPNKQHLGALAETGPPLAQQTWFVAMQGVPVLAFVSALVWRRRSDNLARNPRLRRERQVARVVRAGLQQLRELAAANKSEDFFATLFHLLQEQLGERLDLPASAITEAVIEEHLRPRGVPDDTLAPLQELFQTCNLVRYAPIKSSQELAAMISKLEHVLQRVRELKL